MAATLYPRINITDNDDPGTGFARTPLGIPAYPAGPSDVVIQVSDKNLALQGAFTLPLASIPLAPGGRLLPFHVPSSGIVKLHIAFLDNPAAVVWPPPVPSTINPGTKVSLIPAIKFPATGSLTITDDLLESEWLTVGDTLTTVETVVPYAQFSGSALDGRVVTLTLTINAVAPGPSGTPPGAINAAWFLAIKNVNPLWVTFTVSTGDDVDVKLPWIHVPTAVNLIDGPYPLGLNAAAGTVNVRNYGPGALTVSASSKQEGDGNDVIFVNASVGPIAAASAADITLDYEAHDGLGVELEPPLAVDISSTDTTLALIGDYHNARMSVTATSVGFADTVLVLDASGSMLLRPDGSFPNPGDQRRWDHLVEATNQFVSGYKNFLLDTGAKKGGSLGIAVFPDVAHKDLPGWETRAGILKDSADVTQALPGQVSTLLANTVLEWGGLTPMGEGINVAMGSTVASAGMYQTPAEGRRRWMVLMSDGAHNAGTVHPNQYINADTVPDFDDKKVRVFSIGYTSAAGGTDVALLQSLADGGLNPKDGVDPEESQYKQAIVGVPGKSLTNTFLDALETSLGLTSSIDPSGVLTPQSPIVIHEFHVSPYDTGIGIFLDWPARDADRIQLGLISPRCEHFTQKDLVAHEQFDFRALPGYSHAYISSAAIAGDEHGARHGTWKLVLRLSGSRQTPSHGDFSVGTSEPYTYSIYNRSGLRITGGATKTRLSTNEPIELVVRLRAQGAPVSGARVVGTVDAPSADYGSILAGGVVDPSVMERIQKESPADLAGLWALKALAIAVQGAIEVTRSKSQIVFQEGEPGVYRATIQNAKCGGVYVAQVVATGSAKDVPYRRELAVSMNVEALPDPSMTIVTYTLSENSLMVQVRPRDANGNAVMFDPQSSPRLGIHAHGAKPLGRNVTNQFDGTYTREFSLTGSGQPEVFVTFDDEVVVPATPLPDPGTFNWMDRVVSYDPGCGKKGDPKNALGPVKGPNDPFVPIGGKGSITLAGSRPIHATHVAVFTHAESTQPYRVYVIRANNVPIEIGMGYATQVFEVPSRAVPDRVAPIRQILIRHARDADKPVLLQAVGYTSRRHKYKPERD
jgi:hypothetical protein